MGFKIYFNPFCVCNVQNYEIKILLHSITDMENILLSYPRSGNHLVRFFIELLSEIPTYGCKGNKKDIEIYKNIFPEKVPFNISDFDKKDCYIKYHCPPPQNIRSNKLILIIRNPNEVLLRHNNYKLNIKGRSHSYETYFKNIDYYNNFKKKKLLLYYEDIITNKDIFINTLYDFLDVNNIEKKNYVLSNIDKLYNLSSKGKNRSWGGINSHTTDHYYKKIPESIKEEFDNYINDKLNKYPFLNEKYKNYIKNSNDCLALSFMHIPKTAGTSIEDAAKNNNLHWGRFDKNLKSNGICSWHTPQKLENYCFCVIRDPFDRIISQFYHENEVDNYNKDELNKFIQSKLDIIKNDIHHKDNHYLHQIEFFKYCDIAISYDNIQNNLNELMKLFDLPILKLDRKFGGNLQQVKRKNKNFNRLQYNDINDINCKIIENFYRKDIDLYNIVKQNGVYIKPQASINLINDKQQQSIIISFCNYDYIELAEIWVTELSNLNITNYIIISADQRTYEHLKSKNINTELRNYDKKESFWVYRIKVIKNFLEKNTNDYLVHSDLDAIWKKNICEELFNKNNNIDLLFSQGTTFPKEHLKKHKFVLCCGFFRIRSNEKTIKFINKYINNLEKIKDDQKAINLELIDTKWNIDNNEPKYLPNKKYVYYENDINGYNPEYDINILLISFNKIQREFLDNNGYIYHILSPKICSKKIDLFKKLKII